VSKKILEVDGHTPCMSCDLTHAAPRELEKLDHIAILYLKSMGVVTSRLGGHLHVVGI
jgi:hypothetical protein